MTLHYARTGMKLTVLMLLLLLVWLVTPFAADKAYGASLEDPENHIRSDRNEKPVDFTFQHYPLPKDQPFDNRTSAFDVDEPSRVDLYLVLKLALKEFEFFAGIRHLLDRTEKELEHLAIKLKIKGEISFDEQDRSGGAQLNQFGSDPKHRRHPSARASIFIPREIKWHLGFYPGAKSAFGELNLGPYWTLKGVVGGEQEVQMLFKYEF